MEKNKCLNFLNIYSESEDSEITVTTQPCIFHTFKFIFSFANAMLASLLITFYDSFMKIYILAKNITTIECTIFLSVLWFLSAS